MSLSGVVISGLGQGAYFMNLAWVRDTVRRLIGFTPYPGTLNVRVDPSTADIWREVQARNAEVLPPAPPETCGARLFPVVIVPGTNVEPGLDAAVILPDVTRYGDDVLELIAAVHLRSALALRDGDRVLLQIR